MRLSLLISILFFWSPVAISQEIDHGDLVGLANQYYWEGKYQIAATTFSKALYKKGALVSATDRYNGACFWAMAGDKDSAFSQLNYLVKGKQFQSYNRLMVDPDFTSLRSDPRWLKITGTIYANRLASLTKPDTNAIYYLDTIFREDQYWRHQINLLEKKYPAQSVEKDSLWKIIEVKDSVNLRKICSFLDNKGWLGPNVLGAEGSQTLFLVIQHADPETQQRYLPMMRDAVKKGNAKPSEFALLTDRTLLGEGKRQIYGSQIHGDPNGHYWVSPLEDPANVDKRRAEVGLQPMNDYLKNWGMQWDPVSYQKKLPEIEQLEWGK